MKRLVSALLTFVLLFCVLPLPEIAAEDADYMLTVNLYNSSGELYETRAFNIGDTFTCYATLNFAGMITSIDGMQKYSDSKLYLQNTEFPIIDSRSVFNDGEISFSASSDLPFVFDSADDILIATTYTVIDSGVAEISTPLKELVFTNDHFIVHNGEGFEMQNMCFDLPFPFPLPVMVDEPGSSSGVTGDCTWSLNDKELTISGNGAMGDYNSPYQSPWGKGITKVIISDGVTHIGDYAFYNCSEMTQLIIGDSVEKINRYAFYDCSKLTNLTIPDSVTSIGDYSFYNCRRLTSIDIPDSVTSIGDYAFYNCSGMTQLKIGDSVEKINRYAFYDCSKLTNLTIPDSVTSIGDYAFYNCSGTTQLIIGDSVEKINRYAFYDCSKLTNLTIPDSVTSIGDYSFYNCRRLTSIDIPDSVTSIGDYVFNTDYLKEVTYIGSEEQWNQIDVGSWLSFVTVNYIMAGLSLKNSSYQIKTTDNTTFICDYTLTSEGSEEIRELSAVLSFKDDKELLDRSFVVYVNNKRVDDYTVKNSEIIVPIDDNTFTGNIVIVLQGGLINTGSGVNLHSTAKVKGKTRQGTFCFTAGTIDYKDDLILNAPTVISSEVIPIGGQAGRQTKLTIYIDNIEVGTVETDKTGAYKKEIIIEGVPIPDRVYTVRVKDNALGATRQAERKIKYIHGYPELEDFIMTYRGVNYYLKNTARNNITYILRRWGGNYPFSFSVKFKNHPKGKVYVTSTRKGITKQMELEYDAMTGCFVGKGFFEPYEDDYVPGVLEVVAEEYGTIYTRDTENYCLDPSGYVYAGIDSDRVSNAEVTAYCIPYDFDQDDDSFWNSPDESRKVKWDASEYSQQNPLYTTLDGNYAWDVPEGWWQLEVKKDGYETATTEWMTVLPPRLDVNIDLKTTMTPEIETAIVENRAIKLTFLNAMKPESLGGLTVTDDVGQAVDYELLYTPETGSNGESYAKEFTLKLSETNAETFTVTCADAENYAGVKGMVNATAQRSKLIGDADGDGQITVKDVTEVQIYLSQITPQANKQTLMNADVNKDGILDVIDMTWILRYLAWMNIPYEIG